MLPHSHANMASTLLISLLLISNVIAPSVIPGGQPEDFEGIIGTDGIPIIESGKNHAEIGQDVCAWDTKHGVVGALSETDTIVAGGQRANWDEWLHGRAYFNYHCGACLARADNARGCPAPSIAYSYGCRANDIYSWSQCLRQHSMLYIIIVFILPMAISSWVVLWLSCIKCKMCLCAMCIRKYRKSNNMTTNPASMVDIN